MSTTRDGTTAPHTLPNNSDDALPSNGSHTAQDFIKQQLQLESDAREALPYQFNSCTKPLGSLKQSVFACLTCTPPPASPHQQYTPAGVCYSCSISCHGEHNLVELFTKRNFVCDCGTTRFSNSGTPCSLRVNAVTGIKGGVTGENAAQGNTYNQNFKGTFCGCGEEYDPEKEKGTMFQCLGLGTVEDGGCGEDWWHPECILGVPRIPHRQEPQAGVVGGLETVKEEPENGDQQPPASVEVSDSVADLNDPPLPEGFPPEEDFDHLICYKCVSKHPWIKSYADTQGFLPAVPFQKGSKAEIQSSISMGPDELSSRASRKRRLEDDQESQESKKARSDEPGHLEGTNTDTIPSQNDIAKPKHEILPQPPFEAISLFLTEDFREQFCRCAECFPRLAKHPQLLEEEDTYEPPVSESDEGFDETGSVGGRSVNSGSLLDRGEAALSGMDRVRAIEGVMAYNHVRDKVKAFLQPFAASGTPVGAEDIKAYFAKLRGDEEATRQAVPASDSGDATDNRREQGGY